MIFMIFIVASARKWDFFYDCRYWQEWQKMTRIKGLHRRDHSLLRLGEETWTFTWLLWAQVHYVTLTSPSRMPICSNNSMSGHRLSVIKTQDNTAPLHYRLSKAKDAATIFTIIIIFITRLFPKDTKRQLSTARWVGQSLHYETYS